MFICADLWLISVARDRIEEERIGSQRLATILRAKSEENDAALAQSHFDQRRFAFDAIASQQPAGKQRVFVLGIRTDDFRLNLARVWSAGISARMSA